MADPRVARRNRLDGDCEHRLLLALLALAMLACSLTFSRWLTIMPLGSATPMALGVPSRLSRTVMMSLCGVATSAASMLVGPLSFIGLIAPHITLRAGFIRADQQIIASFLLRAALTAFADFGARAATFPYELPLGLFSALAGAPYLIWQISRR